MKVDVLFLALGMALSLPISAFAAEGQHQGGSGHYEWRPVPQFGPRATGPAQKRVWVGDHAQMANCDCDMMKMSANECMKEMHHMGSPSSGGSAS